MKKIFIILLLSIISAGAVQAQSAKQYYTIGWNINMPIGDFSNFISSTGLRAGYFNIQVFLTDNFAVGGNASWNSYYENVGRQTYNVNEATSVTANSYRYIFSTPVTLNGYYHFLPEGIIQPYAGLGIGVNYLNEHIIVQDYDAWDEQWGFLLNPTIGCFVPLGDMPIGLNLSVGYNFSTNEFNSFTEDYKNFQNLTIGVGLTWMLK